MSRGWPALRGLVARLDAWMQGGPRRVALVVALALVAVLLPALSLAYAASGAAAHPRPAGTHTGRSSAASPTPASSALPGYYRDPLLDFSLRLPGAWSASPQPGVHTWQGSTGERIGVVVLHDPTHTADKLELAVTQGPSMPAAFARLGTPNSRLGPYPAVNLDVTSDDGSPPCAIRIFLAHEDYVVARACGNGIGSRVGLFAALLATYTPDAPTAATTATSLGTSHVRALGATIAVVQPETCAQLVAAATSRPADTSNWGRELASATDPRWNPYPTPGASVCSNFYKVGNRMVSFPGPTFQCVELANRFLREQWGHGGVDGNAAEWFDYFDAGTRHDGYARLYPDAQLSDDASQGTSAFAPSPGDILVWQDVQDGTHWTSGMRHSPGHVAVVTGTDAGHVYIMQQNYNERSYYMSLPLAHVANGWRITDHSGVPGRIVRGWIHFTENGGSASPAPSPTPSPTPATPGPTGTATRQDVYAIGADGQLYGYVWSQVGGWSQAQRVTSADTSSLSALAGTPSLNLYDLGGALSESVYAASADGHLYEYWHIGSGGWNLNDLSAMTPLPAGVSVVGSPSALTYTLPGDARERHAVYVAGSDGNLYRFAWTENGVWTAPTEIAVTDASGSGGSSSAVSGLSAISWVQGQTRDEALDLLRGGQLYEELSTDGATWRQTDLSATGATAGAQPTATVALEGTPAAATYTLNGEQGARRIVTAIGTDGHLYRWLYTPSADGSAGTWSAQDVSHAAGAQAATQLRGSPSIGETAQQGAQAGQPTDALLAIGADGHLYEYTNDTTGWHATDLSATASQPSGAQLTGSPAALSAQLPGDTAAHTRIYAVTQAGTLAELDGAPSTSASATGPLTWSYADHGAPAGVSLAGGAGPAAAAGE